MRKSFSFAEIKDILDENNCIVVGDQKLKDIKFDNIASKSFRNEFSLDWYKGKLVDLEILSKSPARIILVDVINSPNMKEFQVENKLIIFCENLLEVIFQIAKKIYKDIDIIPIENDEFHSIKFDDKNTFIGNNCIIGNAIIGNNCKIYGNCFIGNDVIIKDGVIIYPGSVIGSNGFGFYNTKNNRRERYKHIGKVIIEENVEIGANTCIDKGVFSDTIIGRYTKIDSLVHIGHNVEVGENVFIGSNTTICGSVKIGNNVWISPNSVIKEHVLIEDDVFIGLGSVVVENVGKGKNVVGNFAIDKDKFVLDYMKRKYNL